jgi:cytochrome c oxidase subunit 3
METVAKTSPRSLNPKKFALWIGIVSMSMSFAALTSAYIVKQGEGNWLIFDLPSVFFVSTAIILLSSATMHWAVISAKNDNLPQLKAAIVLTALLGLSFAASQFNGWNALYENQIFFAGSKSNPAGSFVYVLTFLHIVHLAGGIVVLLIALWRSFTFKIHSKNMNAIQLTATYWHFVDVLWVYLFFFLLLNR